MPDLVFLVTGSSSGLGLSIARAVLASGYKVIATMRNPIKTPDIVSEIEATGKGVCIQLDVASDSLEARLEQCTKAFGRIDVVINNAGYGYGGALEDCSIEEGRRLMETLFWGPMRITKAFTPYFRAQGAGVIVNVTSTEGISAVPGLSFYGAAKHALEGASESLTGELAPFGIRVLIAEPGGIRTSFLDPKNISPPRMSDVYEGTPVEYVMQRVLGSHGSQNIDPDKCAQRIVEAVAGGGERWPEGREKLLRLPLGQEFLDRFNAKMEGMSENIKALEGVAKSVDFET